jgi:hypothetical protein
MKFQRIMTTFSLGLVLAASVAFAALPADTYAAGTGLVPCGTSYSADKVCTLCHLVLGVQGVIQWGMKVMTFIALAVITAMGILYVVSAGDKGMMGTAKSGIKASLIGFALMLGGWLIINFIITSLAPNLGVEKGGNWYTFKCSTYSKTGGGAYSSPTENAPKYNGPTGNGTCQPITDPGNPCSVESLKKTCFADVAEVMSKICNKESKGNPFAKSGTDHCPVGGPTVSGGLFQINVTVHGPGCGEGLHVANPPLRRVVQTSSGWGDPSCRVMNQGTLSSCMQQTYEPSWNIERACDIYRRQGLGAWGYSANKCGLR